MVNRKADVRLSKRKWWLMAAIMAWLGSAVMGVMQSDLCQSKRETTLTPLATKESDTVLSKFNYLLFWPEQFKIL